MFLFYFIAMSVSIGNENDVMTDDKDLKTTLHNVVSHAVLRMESVSDAKIRRCIFQEYREWLGSSIDDWVLALPDDWGKSDANFY